MKRKKFKANTKIKCDECKKIMRSRHIIQFKGKMLCQMCKPKIGPLRKKISLKEALNKIYEVKGYPKDKVKIARIFVPSVLAGKEVRLVLID